MSILGFGCMRLPMVGNEVDIPQFCQMVDDYLAAGWNYFDTAHGYIQGMSEKALKAGLTSRYPREKFILTNKLSGNFWHERADIEPLLDEQLAICGVKYFDYYLMHGLNKNSYKTYVEKEAFQEVLRLKEMGKVRHMGISFHDTADVLDKILTDRPDIEIVQIQYNYVDYADPIIQSKACYEVCKKHNKPVIVMEPVKGGSLVNLPQKALDLMTDCAASYAIRFAADPENMVMVLSGMSTQEQMEDNLRYMQDYKYLTEDDLAIIDQVRTIYQGQHRIPCTACRYCVDGCPAGIPIPDLFQSFNDYRREKEVDTAAFAKAAECVECGQCEDICPQHLHIRQLLKDVAGLAE